MNRRKFIKIGGIGIAGFTAINCGGTSHANKVDPADAADGGPAVDHAEGKIVAKYEFTSIGWASFGIVLPKGRAKIGLRIGELLTQIDVKNRWDDGSIRYAILTTKVRQPGEYDIVVAAADTKSFDPAIPAAELTLNIERWGYGSDDVKNSHWGIYKSVLPGSVNTKDLWLDGPLVKEWRVRDIPNKNGTKHPFLSNIWDVRIYNDNSGTIDVAVENVRDVTIADAVIYSTDITIKGQNVYRHDATQTGPGLISFRDNESYGRYQCTAEHGLAAGNFIRITSGKLATEVIGIGDNPRENYFSQYSRTFSTDQRVLVNNNTWEKVFLHRYGARWHKLIEMNDYVESGVKIDFKSWIEAGAIPEYRQDVSNTVSVIDDKQWKSGDILGFANMRVYMGGTGGRGEIGPYPAWTMRYIVHQTPELRKQMLICGDAAGSFASHYTKNDPTKFVTFDENPNYVTASSNGDKPLNSRRGSYISWENAHGGSHSYVPYLVTGLRYYSDELLHYGHIAVNSTGARKKSTIYKGPVLWVNQVRGTAWTIRNVADAAYYTPDDCEYKDYFKNVVERNLKSLDGIFEKEPARVSPLGLVYLANMGTKEARIAPWMLSFLMWSLQHARDQGAQGGTVFIESSLRALFEPVYAETAFNPRFSASYYIPFGIYGGSSTNIKWFQTWKEVFEYNMSAAYTKGREPDWGYGHSIRLAAITAKKMGKPWADKVHDFIMKMLTEKKQLNNMKNGNVYPQYALAYPQ